ncbi:MAG: hypothetical protein MJZ53_00505 [Paludibacteraceae bacterium]|nr:hypothetical protein [Paludibacteraceae bacterium]
MIILYTTGEILDRLLVDDIGNWGRLLHTKGAVRVVVDEIANTPESIRFTKMGTFDEDTSVLDFISQPQKTLDESNAVFIFDVEETVASKIRKEYGVYFVAYKNATKNILTEQGWDWDTSDDSKTQTWPSFLDGHGCPINSAIILDRYMFCPEGDETLDDSLFNIWQIMEAVLPSNIKEKVFNIALVFDYSKGTYCKDDGECYSFKELAERVNKLKRRITRPYHFTIELISVDRKCDDLYSETHDRHIITNYFLVHAGHKMKAYRDPDIPLCNQIIYFKRLFSSDLAGKSSLPIITQTRLKSALYDITHNPLWDDELDYDAEYHYAKDGAVYNMRNVNIENRILTS